MLVVKRCERLERKLKKERRVIWSWLRSRATIEWQQKIWKNNFGACRQGKKEEAAVASPSNGCCFDAVMEQLFTQGATRARQQIQALHEEFIRRLEIPATPVHMAGGEERGGEEEQVHRAASRQMGPPAAGGRNGFPAGSVF